MPIRGLQLLLDMLLELQQRQLGCHMKSLLAWPQVLRNVKHPRLCLEIAVAQFLLIPGSIHRYDSKRMAGLQTLLQPLHHIAPMFARLCGQAFGSAVQGIKVVAPGKEKSRTASYGICGGTAARALPLVLASSDKGTLSPLACAASSSICSVLAT